MCADIRSKPDRLTRTKSSAWATRAHSPPPSELLALRASQPFLSHVVYLEVAERRFRAVFQPESVHEGSRPFQGALHTRRKYKLCSLSLAWVMQRIATTSFKAFLQPGEVLGHCERESQEWDIKHREPDYPVSRMLPKCVDHSPSRWHTWRS